VAKTLQRMAFAEDFGKPNSPVKREILPAAQKQNFYNSDFASNLFLNLSTGH
jgi:hypothetical protein